MNRSDRVDRPLLGVLGVLLMGIGGYALARSYGAFGEPQAHEPVLIERVRTFVGHNHDWLWPAAFALTLIVAWVGYRLLRAKLSPSRQGENMHVQDGDDDLVIPLAVVADAIADDITQDHNVTRATARLSQTDTDHQLHLEITVTDDTAIGQLRARIENEILERARRAMDTTPLHADVAVTVTKPASRQLA